MVMTFRLTGYHTGLRLSSGNAVLHRAAALRCRKENKLPDGKLYFILRLRFGSVDKNRTVI